MWYYTSSDIDIERGRDLFYYIGLIGPTVRPNVSGSCNTVVVSDPNLIDLLKISGKLCLAKEVRALLALGLNTGFSAQQHFSRYPNGG